nr:D-aminoacyl-tRNA deacylase [Cellulosilyticum ruminicola]
MRAVVQRVSSASVVVDERCIGEIEAGLLVLVGIKLMMKKEIWIILLKRL